MNKVVPSDIPPSAEQIGKTGLFVCDDGAGTGCSFHMSGLQHQMAMLAPADMEMLRAWLTKKLAREQTVADGWGGDTIVTHSENSTLTWQGVGGCSGGTIGPNVGVQARGARGTIGKGYDVT